MKILVVTSSWILLALTLGLTSIQAFAPAQRALVVPPRIFGNLRFFATVPEKGEAEVEKTFIQPKDTTADFFNDVKPSLFDGVPYSELTIGVVMEDKEGENRVSQTPDTVRTLVNQGFTVVVDKGGT